jgi:hypothetical protein
MTKFKRKRMAEGLLTGLKEALAFETAFISCRRDILFHIDEHIAALKVLKPKNAYQKRKVLNQLEALETVRCSIRNFVNYEA